MKRVDEIDLELTTNEQRNAELAAERVITFPTAKVIARRDRLTVSHAAGAEIVRDDLQSLADFIARMYGVVGRVDQ